MRCTSLAVSIRKGFLLCWSSSCVFILPFKTITPNRVVSALEVTLRSRHYLLSLNQKWEHTIHHVEERELALNFWTLSLFSVMLSGESLLSTPSFTRICTSCQRLPDYKSTLSSEGTHHLPSPYFDTKRENMCIKTSRENNGGLGGGKLY